MSTISRFRSRHQTLPLQGGITPPPESSFLLLEDGSYLLLEDGGRIILED